MKNIKRYIITFKNREEPVMYISPEGGEQLKKILLDNPPSFIPIKDRLVARSSIDQVAPLYL